MVLLIAWHRLIGGTSTVLTPVMKQRRLPTDTAKSTGTSSFLPEDSPNTTNASSFLPEDSPKTTNTSSFLPEDSPKTTNASSFLPEDSPKTTIASSFLPEDKDSAVGPGDGHKEGTSCSFEDVWMHVGPAGKFQYIQCFVVAVPTLLMSFMSYGFVFIGYTPPHVCKQVNETALLATYALLNDSTAHVSYGQCDITVSINQSGRRTEVESLSCPNGHHFPGGEHMTMVSEWGLVCDKTGRVELAQFVYMLGNIVGCITIPYLADNHGRKTLICISNVLNMLIEFGITFAPNMYVVCSALFIDGVVYGGCNPLVIALGMECLIAKHRPIFGIFLCQIWVFCTLLVAGAGYILQDIGWRYFQAIGALTGVFTLVMPFLLCESPLWLAVKGRTKEALAILKKACQQNGSNFEDVRKSFDEYMASNHPPKHWGDDANDMTTDIFKTSSTPKPPKETKYTLLNFVTKKDSLVLLLVLWYLWTACNLVYFGIFMSSSDLAGNRFINFAILSIVEIPCNILILFLMSRMGRLLVMRVFLALAGIGLMFSTLLPFLVADSDQSAITSLVLVVFGKFAITCVFNVLYIVTPEVFPTVLRIAGNGSCKTIPRIGAMLAPYSRPLYTVAKWAPGTIFTGVCFGGLLLSVVLPETRDRVLPTQLEDMRHLKEYKPLNREKANTIA